MPRHQLTPEGRKLWESIQEFEEIKSRKGKSQTPPPVEPPIPLDISYVQLNAIRYEIMKMIANSKLVIKDCEIILSKISSQEEYMSCDAKAAKTCHENLVKRLERILEGKAAFDHEVKIV